MHRSLRRLLLAVTPLLLTGCALLPAGRGVAVVSAGRSSHIIYCSASAPDSVRLAAAELQRAIRLSTGVEIPVTHQPGSPMICLGDTPASRAVGVAVTDLPDDGFRILTKGTDLFIVGKDTPADKPAPVGWESRGTLFGAYEFLERVLGVRWLIPGDWGEDIPAHAELRIPHLDLTDRPDFAIRGLVDVQDRRPTGDKRPSAPRAWLLRQKLPCLADGRKLQHGHAWDDYGMPALLKAHPEFLAVKGDKGKFCTANPEVIRAFAAGVNQWLDAHPQQRSASISPEDGGGFCQCETCRALVTTDPHGRPSYTLVILKFYNDVARLVAAQHPDRLLGGYVYYNYMYPPNPPVPLEPNVWLVLAPLNYYGYGLLKPLYRAEFPTVIAGWTAVTHNFVYHNYSTWMRAFNGTPLPPGFDILNLEIPTLHRCGVAGVEMLGQGAWGYGGPTNYILAKQLWHADADVAALWREWLQRAYGPGWESMDRLYRLVEAGMKVHKEAESPVYRGAMYEVNDDVIVSVYLPVFPDLERLYTEALAKTATPAQRKRLEMFGDNLVMLHFSLRHAGLLKAPETSAFYRTDEQYKQFLADTEYSLSLYRDRGRRYTGPIWKGEWNGE